MFLRGMLEQEGRSPQLQHNTKTPALACIEADSTTERWDHTNTNIPPELLPCCSHSPNCLVAQKTPALQYHSSIPSTTHWRGCSAHSREQSLQPHNNTEHLSPRTLTKLIYQANKTHIPLTLWKIPFIFISSQLPPRKLPLYSPSPFVRGTPNCLISHSWGR